MAALFHLQTLDQQADVARRRLDEIVSQLTQNEAIKAAQRTLARADEQMLHWKTQVTDFELTRANLKSEADAAEERLYSGQVTNPRELTDLRNKVNELRRRYATLDDPLLEAMLAVDETHAAVVKAQAMLDKVTTEQASLQAKLTTEQADLENRLVDLEAQIDQARLGVQAKFLNTYDTLRQRTGDVTITRVRGEECQACGVRINSALVQQARHGEIRYCPTCGRILYVP